MNTLQRIFLLLFAVYAVAVAAPADGEKPVKVYVLMGEGNMAGHGGIKGQGVRWGDEFSEVEVSVYAGDFYPGKDYSQESPLKRVKLRQFGGIKPDPYPGGGLQIVRGKIAVEQSGVYEVRPGWMGSTYNLMTVNGQEVHCRFPGGESSWTPIHLEVGKPVDFEIAYFTGEADGLGWLARLDEDGTLSHALVEKGRYPYLMKSGRWVSRDDVWCRGVVGNKGDGWLVPGFGLEVGKRFGPELGIGHVLGEYHDGPVLLLKVARNGVSLGWDYLPPGSQRYEVDGKVYAGFMDKQAWWTGGGAPQSGTKFAGWMYLESVKQLKKVLGEFDRSFPQFKGMGYELAGFVWWQGLKDSQQPAYASRYGQNLERLIRMLRQDLDAPDAPFVVGTLGFDGWKMSKSGMLKVVEGQLAVDGDSGGYPDFKGNVKVVETRGLWMEREGATPSSHGFYNHHAEIIMNAGLAFGDGMLELIRDK